MEAAPHCHSPARRASMTTSGSHTAGRIHAMRDRGCLRLNRDGSAGAPSCSAGETAARSVATLIGALLGRIRRSPRGVEAIPDLVLVLVEAALLEQLLVARPGEVDV